MVDIFISYSRKDIQRVAPFAKALENCGWSVWWDRAIPPGKTFAQVIEAAINESRCVVVIWSQNSLRSDWVREEANIGKRRNILIPVIIDLVEPPFGFGLIQAADLTTWNNQTSHPGFGSLKETIISILGPSLEMNKQAQKKAKSEMAVSRMAEGEVNRPAEPGKSGIRDKMALDGIRGKQPQAGLEYGETKAATGHTLDLKARKHHDATTTEEMHLEKPRVFTIILAALSVAFLGCLYLIYNFILGNIADNLIGN